MHILKQKILQSKSVFCLVFDHRKAYAIGAYYNDSANIICARNNYNMYLLKQIFFFIYYNYSE